MLCIWSCQHCCIIVDFTAVDVEFLNYWVQCWQTWSPTPISIPVTLLLFSLNDMIPVICVRTVSLKSLVSLTTLQMSFNSYFWMSLCLLTINWSSTTYSLNRFAGGAGAYPSWLFGFPKSSPEHVETEKLFLNAVPPEGTKVKSVQCCFCPCPLRREISTHYLYLFMILWAINDVRLSTCPYF